ncbi:MAG: hypothetical protein CVU22_00940 [Betaproteobacteria bacterium HGW-Betaproteobacteria-16]|nr:MAG: hypothetical protein CVU22_00940 [Betaproteobacteria bacterium HGW-Betaproteobacteria-16]
MWALRPTLMVERSPTMVKHHEERLEKLGANKDLLGLPVGLLEQIDRALRDRWQVDFFETPLGLVDHVAHVATEGAASRYHAANERAADNVKRGSSETAVYEAMCDAELLGIVTSSRRAFLIDAISLAVAVVRELGLPGPILDAGCHAGIACDILAEVVENEIHGIDPVERAIDVARERVGSKANFEVAAIPWVTTIRFDLVLAVDSMPRNLADRAHFLRGLSGVLNDGGVAVIVSQHWANADMQTLRRQLSSCQLGFGLADVVGGYSGAPTQFSAEGCLVFVKGGKVPPPQRLVAAMESDWGSFRDYANATSTLQSRKTQAFKRARQ